MRTRPLVVVLGVVIGFILLTGTCAAGFVAGRVLLPASQSATAQLPGVPALDAGSSAQNGTPQNLDNLFAPFWQVWQLVHDQYVDQPVDDVTLMRGAIRGMLESLGDAHTSYLDPANAANLDAQLNGDQYEGIGAWVDTSSDFLSIISPIPGSPAEKAGLRPGDKVIAVDGEDVSGIDGEQVRQRILGPRGSTVKLTVSRQGVAQPLVFEIVRASITVPTVQAKILAGNIAYVHLYTFGDTSAQDLHDQLKQLLDQKPQGLILDLRNNGGGYLDTAIAVASEFIGDGAVMYEVYGDGRRVTFDAQPGGLATRIPLVVLINQGSASASEIVAGAVQDRGRGKLVGVTSFGKGSVQTVLPLLNNQGEARVTVARWLTPAERTINGVGLTPDVKVEVTDQDLQTGLDPQLDQAVQLLLKP
jgi:carboxyl-terminal processing protease